MTKLILGGGCGGGSCGLVGGDGTDCGSCTGCGFVGGGCCGS